mgnify:CR=1 FL=1
MTNFSLWKYILVLGVFLFGIIYALPNLSPPDPAVQVSLQSAGDTFDSRIIQSVSKIAKREGILNENIEVNQITASLKHLHSKGIPYSEMAILARTNSLPSDVADILMINGVPVSLNNGVEAFQSDQTRELIAASAIASSQKVTPFWNRKIGPKIFGFAKKASSGVYVANKSESPSNEYPQNIT